MIDLHCHYLPGVDDGAQTMDEGLALARAAMDNGIREAVLTPHIHPGQFDNTRSTLEPVFFEFRQRLLEEGIALEVSLGSEVRLLPESMELLTRGELPILGQWGRQLALLVELPHEQVPAGSLEALCYLRRRGIMPVLAHPERNKDVMRDWRRLQPFVESGACQLQLTAGSVIGAFGKPAQQTARALLDAGWVSLIATDAHNLRSRPPLLREAREAVTGWYGEEAAKLLTEVHPRRLLGKVAEPA
ncbi:MAG TPA: hypothetical protein PKA20_05830 [Burkholderiaceae bacterium]|nr:hypothetical protein [Burkholderiaceae bacterium]